MNKAKCVHLVLFLASIAMAGTDFSVSGNLKVYGKSRLIDSLKFENLAGTGTRMVVADAVGNILTQSIPAAGSLANPTATIGLVPVNGVANSGMRSDGAPALSQAIDPTWSGRHTFQDTIVSSVGIRVGSDSRIYRDGAQTIRTNASLVVDGGLKSNTLAAASGNLIFRTDDGITLMTGFSGTGFSIFPNDVQISGVFNHRASRSFLAVPSVSSDTVYIDANVTDFFAYGITANSVLAAQNGNVGSHFTLRIKQDGVGGRTLTYTADFRFPSGSAPTLTTVANATDYLSFIYDEVASKWDFVGNAFNLQ